MCLTLAVLCPTLVEALREHGKALTKIRPIAQGRQLIDLSENVQQIAQVHENGHVGHRPHCWALMEGKIGDGNIANMLLYAFLFIILAVNAKFDGNFLKWSVLMILWNTFLSLSKSLCHVITICEETRHPPHYSICPWEVKSSPLCLYGGISRGWWPWGFLGVPRSTGPAAQHSVISVNVNRSASVNSCRTQEHRKTWWSNWPRGFKMTTWYVKSRANVEAAFANWKSG